MNWAQLLSAKRSGDKQEVAAKETRNRFEQDFDRIVFSHPFRRLQDKTQVFPMPEDDFVHNRLTHSLEVSSVGRSLGKEVGKIITGRHKGLADCEITYNEFGTITATASLAHDIGNPPFGHSGEDGISAFFQSTEAGAYFKDTVSDREWSDLTRFEGNAQGFRILNSPMYGGLRLTFAALAAFTKYPKSSSGSFEKSRKSLRKYGFSQTETTVFSEVAQTVGLIRVDDQTWRRHPLAFLVEAADDICYHIIDLEDGTRLGLVPFSDTQQLLADIIGDQFSPRKLAKLPDLNEKLGTLRALAINRLVTQIVERFADEEVSILKGEYDQALADDIPAAGTLGEIIKISIDKIYRSGQVLQQEAAGFEVIEKLMSAFSHAIYFSCLETDQRNAKHKSIFRLLPGAFRAQLQKEDLSAYQALQVCTDFVSGLTDRSALKLYRTISGFPLR